MIDLHSHLLPGVDDGSKSLQQSVEVLTQMHRDGVTSVCLTPHLTLRELTPNSLTARLGRDDQIFSDLGRLAPRHVSLHRGFELMIDGPLTEQTRLDRASTVNGSRYLLIEFPPSISALAVAGIIRMIVERKLVPLVAHAERYPISSPSVVLAWKDAGAVIQVDATTLSREKGSRALRARTLVERGLADIIAADNHGDDRSLRSAADFLESRKAFDQVHYLLNANPRSILDDTALEPVPEVKLVGSTVFSFMGSLRRFLR